MAAAAARALDLERDPAAVRAAHDRLDVGLAGAQAGEPADALEAGAARDAHADRAALAVTQPERARNRGRRRRPCPRTRGVGPRLSGFRCRGPSSVIRPTLESFFMVWDMDVDRVGRSAKREARPRSPEGEWELQMRKCGHGWGVVGAPRRCKTACRAEVIEGFQRRPGGRHAEVDRAARAQSPRATWCCATARRWARIANGAHRTARSHPARRIATRCARWTRATARGALSSSVRVKVPKQAEKLGPPAPTTNDAPPIAPVTSVQPAPAPTPNPNPTPDRNPGADTDRNADAVAHRRRRRRRPRPRLLPPRRPR